MVKWLPHLAATLKDPGSDIHPDLDEYFFFLLPRSHDFINSRRLHSSSCLLLNKSKKFLNKKKFYQSLVNLSPLFNYLCHLDRKRVEFLPDVFQIED